jgi:hypothetical protein
MRRSINRVEPQKATLTRVKKEMDLPQVAMSTRRSQARTPEISSLVSEVHFVDVHRVGVFVFVAIDLKVHCDSRARLGGTTAPAPGKCGHCIRRPLGRTKSPKGSPQGVLEAERLIGRLRRVWLIDSFRLSLPNCTPCASITA